MMWKPLYSDTEILNNIAAFVFSINQIVSFTFQTKKRIIKGDLWFQL